MKKTIIILICIFIAIIISLYTYYQSTQSALQSVKKFNYQFEQYFDKEIYGADVVTIMSKAIDNNNQYNIARNEENKFIEDNKYCLKVMIKFKDVDKIFDMESIEKAGIEGFMQNFAKSTFKIIEYDYNDESSRIGRIVIEEIQIGNI